MNDNTTARDLGAFVPPALEVALSSYERLEALSSKDFERFEEYLRETEDSETLRSHSGPLSAAQSFRASVARGGKTMRDLNLQNLQNLTQPQLDSMAWVDERLTAFKKVGAESSAVDELFERVGLMGEITLGGQEVGPLRSVPDADPESFTVGELLDFVATQREIDRLSKSEPFIWHELKDFLREEGEDEALEILATADSFGISVSLGICNGLEDHRLTTLLNLPKGYREGMALISDYLTILKEDRELEKDRDRVRIQRAIAGRRHFPRDNGDREMEPKDFERIRRSLGRTDSPQGVDAETMRDLYEEIARLEAELNAGSTLRLRDLSGFESIAAGFLDSRLSGEVLNTILILDREDGRNILDAKDEALASAPPIFK